MPIKPDPCPFCDSKNVTVIIDDDFDAVACRDCEASGPTGKNARDAIVAWNRRDGVQYRPGACGTVTP